jgi:hypothetical protein
MFKEHVDLKFEWNTCYTPTFEISDPRKKGDTMRVLLGTCLP